MTESNTTELAAVQAAATTLAPLSIKDTVLAQFKEAETSLTTLADRYRNVAYDTTTPKGMRDAIAARADLRDNGRLFVTRAEKRIKSDVNDLKRVMADEVERLVAIVQPVEESIDKQIKAEEERKAAEKAERERIEAERIGVHRANIDKLKSYAARAEGQPVDAIERAIQSLEALQIGAEWEEFADAARGACASTCETLKKMVANERQRLENERLAKELAEAKAALAAERAETDRIRAEEERKAREAAEREAEVERARIRAEEQHKAQMEAEQAAQASAALLQQAKAQAADLVQTAREIDAERVTGKDFLTAATGETLTLGAINALLSPIRIDAAGLADIGFSPCATVKAAKHYPATDMPAICQALIARLQGVMAEA